MTTGTQNGLKKNILIGVMGILTLLSFAALPAHADTTITTSPRGLQEALASVDHQNIYRDNQGGFSLSSNFFSGRASGNEPLAGGYLNGADSSLQLDRTAEMEGDQRVYALLVDGSYDFNYDLGTGLPIHPYLAGGMGMAMYGAAPGNSLGMQDGDMVPLFRLGGGVTYRLGEQWNLSLDYKAGLTGGGDQIFTVRSQQPVDMQVLNMGMHYSF
jgi:opacity protein-like surface antigen